MKAKGLATVEGERKQEVKAHPEIAFTQAITAQFLWRDELHTVGTCPLPILHDFLAHYGDLVLSSQPARLKEALSCLDAGYGKFGRWQAIDTLLVYKVVLPLVCSSQ